MRQQLPIRIADLQSTYDRTRREHQLTLGLFAAHTVAAPPAHRTPCQPSRKQRVSRACWSCGPVEYASDMVPLSIVGAQRRQWSAARWLTCGNRPQDSRSSTGCGSCSCQPVPTLAPARPQRQFRFEVRPGGSASMVAPLAFSTGLPISTQASAALGARALTRGDAPIDAKAA